MKKTIIKRGVALSRFLGHGQLREGRKPAKLSHLCVVRRVSEEKRRERKGKKGREKERVRGRNR